MLAVIPTMAPMGFGRLSGTFDKYLIAVEFGGITDEEQFKDLRVFNAPQWSFLESGLGPC